MAAGPVRRQATLTVASALLCGLDLLLAPVLLLIAALMGPYAARHTVAALAACGAASLVCGIGALVAGLAGAPSRLVLGLALLPVLALAGFIAALFLFGS